MIETHEPKDGDFIALIEQLQKESAARLSGGGQQVITQLEKKQESNKGGSHFFAGRKPADMRSAAEVQAAFAQVADRASFSKLFGAALAIVIGALLAFYWLIASASLALLVVAAVMILWGARSIQRAWRRFSPRQNKQARVIVTKVFTAPTKPK